MKTAQDFLKLFIKNGIFPVSFETSPSTFDDFLGHTNINVVFKCGDFIKANKLLENYPFTKEMDDLECMDLRGLLIII